MKLTAENLAALKAASRKREATFDASTINKADRTCVVAFASETPARQFIGIGNIEVAWEILSLASGACNLERLNSGAPLLFNHDRDAHIGTIVKAWVDADGVGRALVKFSESTLGEEKWCDVQAAILTKVSVGYIDCGYVIAGENAEDGLPILRAETWLPIEISLVTIPADNSVGVGRALPEAAPAATAAAALSTSPETTPAAAAAPVPDAVQQRSTDTGTKSKPAANMNRKEINAKIRSLVAKYGKLVKDEAALRSFADTAIDSGEQTDVDVQAFINSNLSERSVETSTVTVSAPRSQKREALQATLRSAGTEKVAAKINFRAAAIDGSATKGGEMIQTDVQATLPALRAKSIFLGAGAKILTGLQGNLLYPRTVANAKAAKAAKGAAVTGTAPVTGSIPLAPKRLGLTFNVDKSFFVQVQDADLWLEDQLNGALALGLDSWAIAGTGEDEPEGLLKRVGEVQFGATGLNWDKTTEFLGKVALANYDFNSCRYLINPLTMAKAMSTVKAAGQGGFILENGKMAGYTTAVSNQMGETNRVIFGDVAQTVFALWGDGYEIILDPISRAEYNEIKVVAHVMADFGVLQPGAFAVSKDGALGE